MIVTRIEVGWNDLDNEVDHREERVTEIAIENEIMIEGTTEIVENETIEKGKANGQGERTGEAVVEEASNGNKNDQGQPMTEKEEKRDWKEDTANVHAHQDEIVTAIATPKTTANPQNQAQATRSKTNSV